MMRPNIRLFRSFLPGHRPLYTWLTDRMQWDTRLRVRKTLSFGMPYNYSGMVYVYRPMPECLHDVAAGIANTLGFHPNNCLLNYYPDGRSTMGYHADDTALLHPATGVVVISLGATRTLCFKHRDAGSVYNYELEAGSLLYMPIDVQIDWRHAVPKSDTALGRISLTFRQIVDHESG